jgi:hypothetical protein
VRAFFLASSFGEFGNLRTSQHVVEASLARPLRDEPDGLTQFDVQ